MTRYTLDYSPPSPTQRRRVLRKSAQWPHLLALLGLCLALMATIYAYYLRAETHHLRAQYNALTLRYDSLLAAQLYQKRSLTRSPDQRQPPPPLHLPDAATRADAPY